MLSCHAKPSVIKQCVSSFHPQPRRSSSSVTRYSKESGHAHSSDRKAGWRPGSKVQQLQRRTSRRQPFVEDQQSNLLLTQIQQQRSVQQLSTLVAENRPRLQAKHLTACLTQLVDILEGSLDSETSGSNAAGQQQKHHLKDQQLGDGHSRGQRGSSATSNTLRRVQQASLTHSNTPSMTDGRSPPLSLVATSTTSEAAAGLGHELLTLCASLGPDGVDSQAAALSVWAAAKLRCCDADPGLLSELLHLAALKAGDMKDKELAALWHGVATLPTGILQASAPALGTLLSETHPISMATWSAHAICTTLWALARLQAQPSPAWWEELFTVTKGMLGRMNGQEACTLMWALHRMGIQPDPAWVSAFFSTTAVAMLQPSRGYSGRDVASLAWAVASLGLRPSLKWVARVCEASTPHMMSMDVRALCGLAYAVSRLSKTGIVPVQSKPSWSAATAPAAMPTSGLAPQTASSSAAPPLPPPSTPTPAGTSASRQKQMGVPTEQQDPGTQSDTSSQPTTTAGTTVSDRTNDEIRRRIPSVTSHSKATRYTSWRVPQPWEDAFLDAVQEVLPHMQGSQVAEVVVSAWRLGLRPDTGWLADLEIQLARWVPVSPQSPSPGVGAGGAAQGRSAATGRTIKGPANSAAGSSSSSSSNSRGDGSIANGDVSTDSGSGSQRRTDNPGGTAGKSGPGIGPTSLGAAVKVLVALQDHQLAAAMGVSVKMAGWMRKALRHYYKNHVDLSG